MRVPETDARVVENFRRFRALAGLQKRKDPTGLKRWYVPGLEGSRPQGGHLPAGREFAGVATPYAAKMRLRRRAARKVAHESRRRNR